MKKRIVITALVICLIISVLPVSADAAYATATYDALNKSLTFTGYGFDYGVHYFKVWEPGKEAVFEDGWGIVDGTLGPDCVFDLSDHPLDYSKTYYFAINHSAGPRVAYGTVTIINTEQLSFKKASYSCTVGETISITAIYRSFSPPESIHWSCNESGSVFFSGDTSRLGPEETGEENTWWLSRQVIPQKDGSFQIDLSVNGEVASTKVKAKPPETVIDVTGIAFETDQITLYYIENSPVAQPSTSLQFYIYPTDATYQAVYLSSSNPSVVSVNNDPTVANGIGKAIVHVEGVGSAIITVTTFDGAFHAECQVTVELRRIWSEDYQWSFTNTLGYSTDFDTEEHGYYITNSDHDRLIANLHPYDELSIDYGRGKDAKTKKEGIVFLYNVDGNSKKYAKWGGSCQGMSVWAALVFDNILDFHSIPGQSGISSLHQVDIKGKYADNIRSAVNFYHYQWQLTAWQNACRDFMDLSQVEQLQKIEEMVLSGTPVLIDYSWIDYTKPNPKGSGHAVVAYAIEAGPFVVESNGLTSEYTKKIKIYDCAAPLNPDYDIYYTAGNGVSVWCLPGHNIISYNSTPLENESYPFDDNGAFTMATNDVELLNAVSYIDGSLSGKVLESKIDSARLYLSSEGQFTLETPDGSISANGIRYQKTGMSSGTVAVAIQPNYLQNGDTIPSTLTYFLPEENEYKIITNNNLSFGFSDNEKSSFVSAESSGSITFTPETETFVQLDQPKKLDITLISESDDCEWNTVNVVGDTITSLRVIPENDSITLEGDHLEGVVIEVTGESSSSHVVLQDNDGSVKISLSDGAAEVKDLSPIQSLSVSDGKVVAELAPYVEQEAHLFFASYAADGRMLSFAAAKVGNEARVEVGLDTAGAAKVSAFLVENQTSVKPLCHKFEKSLSDIDNRRITGTVTDRSGWPLSSVQVSIFVNGQANAVASAITADDGSFSVEIEQDRIYELQLSKNGYQIMNLNHVRTSDALNDVGTIKLSERKTSLSEAEILYRGSCGENATWELDENGLLAIRGLGRTYASYDNDNTLIPWNRYATSIKRVFIENGITGLCDTAFYWCENLIEFTVESGSRYYSAKDGVLFNANQSVLICYPSGRSDESYIVPATVTHLATLSFAYSLLKNITLPNGLRTFGLAVFENCYYLESVSVPEGVTTLTTGLFDLCTSLQTLYIPLSVTTIQSNALHYCNALKTVVYAGSRADWNQITIEGGGNQMILANVEIIYQG